MAAVVAAVTLAATVVNTTVYRVTPLNYTGLTNMDSGDLYGDCAFGLWELSFPFWCKDNQQIMWCQNQPILNIPGYNIYEQHVVEHDSRMGLYGLCNPNPDSGEYECKSWGANPPCWTTLPNADKFKDVCDPDKCYCKAMEEEAMGENDCVMCPTSCRAIPDLPKQCYWLETHVDSVPTNGTVLDTLSGKDDGECCDACSASPKGCHGIAYTPSTQTCVLYGKDITTQFVAKPGTWTGGPSIVNGDAPFWWGGIGTSANTIKGTWYSTRAEGECGPGQTPGVDCWWRNVETIRRVNATCVSQNLVKGVQQQRPSCFDKCPPGSTYNSLCYVSCIWGAIAGDGGLAPLTGKELCKGFVSSFESKDPAQLGCPDDHRTPTH